MKVCFLGTSHAAQHLSKAAQDKGFTLCSILRDADLVFVSEDTPTDENGVRRLPVIRALIDIATRHTAPIVLTSAVPPGFCREVGIPLWHQAEILRIKDAEFRARHPEQMIVGSATGREPIPDSYARYLAVWKCPVLRMTWEEAEFAKLAINSYLAAQVDRTNRLFKAAAKVGADWNVVRQVLVNDRRIGQHAYLEPGRWQDSPHLLRDDVTLREIEAR